MHKVKYNSAPKSLTGRFCTVRSSTDNNMLGANSKFVLPRPQKKSLKESFSYSGAKTWHSYSLPEHLRLTESLESFKCKTRSLTLLDSN